MKEKPILFNTEMVRAILEGRKTQTRRVVVIKNTIHTEERKHNYADEITSASNIDKNEYWVFTLSYKSSGIWRTDQVCIKCPYGKPGDRLWVRETCVRFTGLPVEDRAWPLGSLWKQAPDKSPYKELLHIVKNEESVKLLNSACACVTVPSIFMPRWASRITLEITDIRVERVQEISEEDAKAEGIERLKEGIWQYRDYSKRYAVELMPIQSFETLWNSINEKRGYGWDKNCWVWVLTFKKVMERK